LQRAPVGLIKQGKEQEQKYDKEKYHDMLLQAAETVLGYFGFNRTAFGKWWYALSEERNMDIDNEKI
jgi:hypothetical protein